MVRSFFFALTLLLPSAAAAQVAAVDSIVRDGVARGVYPGAVVVIGTHDRILHARGYGHFTWSATSPVPDPDSTVWDLASLTKVVATTGVAAVLVDIGQLSLDAKVQGYLPRFVGPGKEKITVRMLLDHTSGLPAWVDFARLTRDRDGALDLLYRTPLQRPPGARAVYSDLNAILLGLVIEALTGRSLAQVAQDRLYAPLRMANTRFLPPRYWLPRIAPTGQWHGHPVAGEVNDQNSKRLGGIAGHAGLFSTGSDLAKYAQWWLRLGDPLIHSNTADLFLTAGSTSGSRLLGWESRTTTEYTPSPYGILPSATTFGHTGWTGTMIWIDRDRDLFVVFLTDRAFGPRVAKPFQALHQVRAALADAAVRADPAACRAEIRPSC